jgi:hypothetical protein
VPGERGRGERRIEDALRALGAALDATGAPWMIIGGIAVIARGVRRMTTDIDAAVRGDAVELERLVGALKKKRMVPRIPRAEQFARANLVLLVRHEPTGVDLDISLAWTAFEQEALGARERVRYGRVAVPMARPEDLVIYKAMAHRPKDVEDAQSLLPRRSLAAPRWVPMRLGSNWEVSQRLPFQIQTAMK